MVDLAFVRRAHPDVRSRPRMTSTVTAGATAQTGQDDDDVWALFVDGPYELADRRISCTP